ncbi:MAG: biopolymer transport protein ExbD [Polyangiales bacterium]
MAGGAMGGGDDDDLISDINVTPLVDVVLVLLIVLMVTATAIVSKTIPMELPSASTAESPPITPTTLGISIDEEGTLFLDREEVTEAQLRERVRAAHDADSEVRAIIAGDGRIAYARVVRIIDILRQLQVTKFAINVAAEDLEGD